MSDFFFFFLQIIVEKQYEMAINQQLRNIEINLQAI